MWFGNRISSPIHLTTVTIPIQNQKCLKNTKKRIRGQQFSPCHLKCSRDFVVFTNAFTGSPSEFAGTSIQARRTNSRKRAQASPFFFSPFTNFREAGLSEEQCLRVIAMFHFLSLLFFRSLCHGTRHGDPVPQMGPTWPQWHSEKLELIFMC